MLDKALFRLSWREDGVVRFLEEGKAGVAAALVVKRGESRKVHNIYLTLPEWTESKSRPTPQTAKTTSKTGEKKQSIGRRSDVSGADPD
jgi:hypothetical protein